MPANEGLKMRSVVNHLTQLQELVLIRDEQRSLPGGSDKLGTLGADIEQLTDALTPEIRGLFQRLYKRDHVVMAPLNEGACSVCGMRLTPSTVQAVRLYRALQTCPGCTRILYDSEGPKWVGEKYGKRPGTEQKSGLNRFSSPSLMLPDMKAETREEAILALAQLMEKERFIDDADKLAEAANARERVVSTSVGHNLAFPHVRGVEGGGLALALGISQAGVSFDGNELTHFIFFSTIPTAVSAFYLKLMAGVSEAFRKEANREAALAADTPETLWRAVTKATRYSIK